MSQLIYYRGKYCTTPLIGCDPEFLAIKTNKLADASIHLPFSVPRGAVGSDGPALEVRPGTSYDVFALIAQIRECLKFLAINSPGLRKYQWIAGHGIGELDVPTGGHIHISWELNDNTPDESSFVDLLDTVLYYGIGNHIDDIKARESRQNAGYGEYSEYYSKSLDSTSHIEYRTPGSWLVSPKVALLNLGSAKLAFILMSYDNSIRNAPEEIQSLKEFLYLIKKTRIHTLGEDLECTYELLKKVENNRFRKPAWTKDFKKAWRI